MRKLQPTSYGKYLLVDKIATGGMAELFRAKITGVEGFEKLIAIKKILPHLNEEQDLIESFIDEAKLAALLHQQNIVQIFDFGNIDETYFIAMEYLFGKDLRAISRKATEKDLPISVEYALFIVSCICAGLDYAHNLRSFQGNALNIVHRDISPQNVLITYEGEVKVVDFGIAKAASKSSLTETGMIKGKVAYMSPEQAGGTIIDHRSDIFSTGIILYELVTGKRMFQGDTLQILSMVRNAEFEPPEAFLSGLPEELYRILNRALAKDPDERYQSCGEMHDEVEECLAHFSLRPNASGLSKYMKNLFADEITSETRMLKDVGLVSHPEDPAAPRKLTLPLDKVKDLLGGIGATLQRLLGSVKEKASVLLTKGRATISERPKLWIGIGSGAALLVALILAVSLLYKPSSTVDQAKPENTPVAATPSEPSAGTKAVAPPVKLAKAEPAELENAMRALDKRRYATAVELFQKAAASEPSIMKKAAPSYARALRGQGASLVDRKPKQAESLLKKAVELDPQNAEGHFQLGLIFVNLKNHPEAIEALRKAADLDPSSADTFFNLGFVYAVTKNYPNAEKMFSRVTELKPSYLDEAYFNLAMVQKIQGKQELTIKNLKQALRVNPKNRKASKYLKQLEAASGESK
jgi:tetratricopeptide (TPR) repeat protein